MSSETGLQLTSHIAIAAGVLSLILLLATLVTHFWRGRQASGRQRLRAQWMPVFFGVLDGSPVEAPQLRRSQRATVLRLWLDIMELVRGEARQHLAELAQRLQFDQPAARWLRRRSIRRRSLGAAVLGRMRAQGAFPSLVPLLDHPHPTLALLAMRGLLQINAKAALPLCLPKIALRPDWSLIRLAAILADVPRGTLRPAFGRALLAHRNGHPARLLRLLRPARIDPDARALARFLQPFQPPPVLVAALDVVRTPQLLRQVRWLRHHPDRLVRAGAAAAIARVGNRSDLLSLSVMLTDGDWAVRHAAALALVRMPDAEDHRVDTLLAELDNPRASAMLVQARAEVAAEESAR